MSQVLSFGSGSRKVAMFIVCLTLATVMAWFGKVTGPEWIGFVQWLFGFLAAGLTAEHFSSGGKVAQ